MKRRVVIFIGCWFFAAGIIIASYIPKLYLSWDLLFFSLVIISIFLVILFWRREKYRTAFIWGAFLFFGIWRFSISLPINYPNQIFYYNGNKIEFIGQVIAEPIAKGTNQKLEVASLGFSKAQFGRAPLSGLVMAGNEVLGINGNVLVVASSYPVYHYGDVLKISCKLEEPGIIESFDYGKYLAAKGMYSTCSFPKVYLAKDSELSTAAVARRNNISKFKWLFSRIYKTREILSASIDKGLIEPEAGLLKAFMFNEPTVSEDLSDIFRKSGLSHIVAISGSHISELIGIIFFVLLFLGLNRRMAFWFSVPVILFYVVMIGAPASATRAGVMGFIVLLAMYVGRLSRLDYSLVISGVVMLLFNPLLIIADAGFQLSFLAVLGMIYLFPVIDKQLSKYYEGKTGLIKIICQTLALTIAAQIFTAPILIFGFQQVSIIAPLANLAVLWAAPFIMISTFIAMGLSFIIPAGTLLFFLPTIFLLKYLIAVAAVSILIPGAFLIW